MFGTKKCFQGNVIIVFGVRDKYFCEPPDDSDSFWKVVWDLGHTQKQTRRSYDTPIDFYATKRKQVPIFSFS